ncbi:UNVERIFIED_CONTAM: Rho GTPase-activating protein 7 [Sesamum angustifolium]|uniref:Rho GTPase-activating protein 7 n=1 Tax=Sesamum angustifolium TaxID=2727405 RepID=A0AAW2QTC0_9LAMI
MSASLAAFERPRVVNSNTIFKSGHLLISSKGLGWKSWKKRWFILTRTSLVFFKNDPSALPQRGGEVNLTLGGIDLNNSGSVVVREDKKLLTVLFPDGRDGRAFTLKAETLEDLYEWKTALEHALAQAPSAALVMGHNGIFRSDTNDTLEGSFHQYIDGGPSFLEKALRFLESMARLNLVRMRMPMSSATVLSMFFGSYPSSPVPSAAAQLCWKPTMMHTISSHASENRMTPSAVAACMAPLLLRPLLAGECELEDDYDVNGDNSAQLLAAANAANNAQAIITTLLEEYENIFDDDSMNRCSLSADSQSASSRSEDMSDDENPDINANGYHDAENEVDPEADYDRDRRLSGKLSESSGSAASDLYEAIGNDDSDDGSSTHNGPLATKLNPTLDSKPLTDPNLSVNEQLDQQKACENTDTSAVGNDSQRSMGDILSSMDQELNQSIPGPELLADKPMPKLTNSSLNAKKSAFWGRKNARRTPSTESIDSSGEEELAIQRLEIVKNDLRQRIAKEARGNAILQASLERRKQALHERRLALEQDVARLQEQLQAERDLRAALEVGLSMSSGQFSGSRAMDSKTRAELEEIALAEADVARLKQKVAELHHQLNQQRQHHYGLSDAIDRYQHAPDQSLQQKYFQQDFDTTLAVCNHERKQRTEEFLGAEPRTTKGQLLTSGSSGQPSKKQLMESTSPAASKSSEASTSVDNLYAVDSASLPSTSRVPEVMEYTRHPTAASSTLVELTTRLDFFKERRSQLMEQLHNLDLNYGSTPQDFVYKLSSPPWN